MPEHLSLVSIFLGGLIGSVHCLGMCGGITGALTMALPAPVRQSYARLLPYLLAYNVGRVTSYVAAGALAGLVGGQLTQLLSKELAHGLGRMVAGGFMVALGLYLGGWWMALSSLERLGAHLWRRIEPLGRGLLPPRRPRQALWLGVVWGWLPCGLVYSALAWALAAGGALQGGLIMLAFGLGTLPMLLTMGAAARGLGEIVRRPWVRRLAGGAVVAFGLYVLFWPAAHHHPVDTNAVGAHHSH